jgi:hypothetical protein
MKTQSHHPFAGKVKPTQHNRVPDGIFTVASKRGDLSKWFTNAAIYESGPVADISHTFASLL